MEFNVLLNYTDMYTRQPESSTICVKRLQQRKAKDLFDVGEELNRLIDARIVSGASQGVEIPTNTANISGTGMMRIKLVEDDNARK